MVIVRSMRRVKRGMAAVLHTPRMVDAEVARDRVEPRGELGAAIELRSVLNDAGKCLLGEIRSRVDLADVTGNEIVERSLIARQQHSKSLHITRRVTVEQLIVWHLLERPAHLAKLPTSPLRHARALRASTLRAA
jgi:hypothetical protein